MGHPVKSTDQVGDFIIIVALDGNGEVIRLKLVQISGQMLQWVDNLAAQPGAYIACCGDTGSYDGKDVYKRQK